MLYATVYDKTHLLVACADFYEEFEQFLNDNELSKERPNNPPVRGYWDNMQNEIYFAKELAMEVFVLIDCVDTTDYTEVSTICDIYDMVLVDDVAEYFERCRQFNILFEQRNDDKPISMLL